MIYAFKTIAPVPTAKEFVDIILSQTQRKTPTVVHKGYKIARIRKFYLRKIKFTQENFHERLDAILNQFPKLDDIHPFYADLINVLYSRDHYKLALGQVSTARTLIDNVGKDYLKLLKFGDSLYRCKELKRAALGRMCTVTKKLSASLKYLESVRQHLARLPSIDPTTRTLLITGYPNVGKSSFINKISNANVEVQPYAFTTKSLFIGHFDYKYQRWQIIDTPGILDHPLEERNTIEMQAITALAHLQSSVLFLIDISEQCGYSLKQQISLFHSIKALFANKPLVIVANKIDVRPLSSLSSDEKAMINSMLDGRPASETKFLSMSNVSEEGIQQVMTEACEILLAHRVEKKLKTKKVNDIINRIQVTLPTPRDNRDRTASIPASVLTERTMLAQEKSGILNETDPVKLSERSSREGGFSFQLSTNQLSSSSSSAAEPKKKTMKDVEAELGGPGIFNVDFRGHWDLDNPEWRYDVIPEVMDGKNIVDFVDPDIEEKLAALEKEEEEQLEAWIAQKATEGEDEDEMDEEDEETLQELRNIKKTIHNNAILNHTNNRPQVPRKVKLLSRSTSDATKDLAAMGVDTTKFASSIRARSKSRTKGMKRDRDETEMDVEKLRQSKDDNEDGDDMAIEDSGRTRGRSRTARSVAVGSDDRAPSLTRSQSMARDRSRGRSKSRPGSETSFRNVRQKMQAEKLAKTVQRPFQRDARLGEGDRHVFDLKPKHLYSGKMTIGKLDRR